MKNKYIFGILILSSIFSGCSYFEEADKRNKAEEDKLATTGEITDLGVVDGCEVKKYIKTTPNEKDADNVDYHSFYIAKCNGKETTTTTQKVGGKFKHDEAMISVEK